MRYRTISNIRGTSSFAWKVPEDDRSIRTASSRRSFSLRWVVFDRSTVFQVKSVDDLSGRSNALQRGYATSSVSCVAPNDVYPSQPTPLHPLEYGERRIFNLMENTELLTSFMSYREANLRHVTNIIKTDVIDYFVTYRGEKISKLGNHFQKLQLQTSWIWNWGFYGHCCFADYQLHGEIESQVWLRVLHGFTIKEVCRLAITYNLSDQSSKSTKSGIDELTTEENHLNQWVLISMFTKVNLCSITGCCSVSVVQQVWWVYQYCGCCSAILPLSGSVIWGEICLSSDSTTHQLRF